MGTEEFRCGRGSCEPCALERRIQICAWVIACVPKVAGEAKKSGVPFDLAQIYADLHGIVDVQPKLSAGF
jgi:hypothetical protein